MVVLSALQDNSGLSVVVKVAVHLNIKQLLPQKNMKYAAARMWKNLDGRKKHNVMFGVSPI
jgi:hypothetical protein